MKLSKEIYDIIGAHGWPPARIARFLKRANRVAMKMMLEAEGAVDASGCKDHQLTIRTKAFKDAAAGMQTAIAAAEHAAKIALLVEAVSEIERPAGGFTITISPTPEARIRLDDDGDPV